MGLTPGMSFRRLFLGAALALGLTYSAHAGTGTPQISLYHPLKSTQQQNFAIGVKSTTPAQSVARDIVILVDTSASQMGEHRQLGLSVLEGFLSGLTQQDRVRFVAVDVAVNDLSDQFATADSQETQDSLHELKNRIPLGSTSLQPGIQHAINLLSESRSASIFYLGDGMSNGELIKNSEMQALIGQLLSNKIAVNSFAVGPKLDLQLVGVLANLTGGVVQFDQDTISLKNSNTIGQQLAADVKKTIVYGNSIHTASAMTLPTQALPLRSDRETIYMAHGTLPEQVTVNSQNVKITRSEKIADILSSAWNSAEQSNGLKVSLAGEKLLRHQESGMLAQLDYLGEQAERALDLNKLQQANNLGQFINRLNPGNEHADELLKETASFKIFNVSQNENGEQLDERTGAQAADLLAEEEERVAIKEQRYRLEVERLIESARELILVDPQSVIGELKTAIEQVSRLTDIGPDVRDELIRRLSSRLAEAQNRIEVAEQNRIMQEVRTTQQEARQRAVDQFLLKEQELEALMERVSGLLNEGAHGDDDAYEEAQAVAKKALEAFPRNGTATAARVVSEARTQLNLVYRLNQERRDKWLATLEEVEKSHVPFPDEPPIVYPAPAIWRALTRTREKWKQVSIFKQTPVEKRIRESLDKDFDLSVEGLTIEEMLEEISTQGNFIIQVDPVVADVTDALSSETIERNYSGIKLRSVLRLVLEPHELTYAINNEILVITTNDEALANPDYMQLQIYPVTDLVIPIQNMQGGGGGGLGQAGGGGFGQGGGGFGQGGGGFGGFSVPDTIPHAPVQFNVPDEISKKKQ